MKKGKSASKRTDDQLRQTRLCQFMEENYLCTEGDNPCHGDIGFGRRARNDNSREGGLT